MIIETKESVQKKAKERRYRQAMRAVKHGAHGRVRGRVKSGREVEG